MTRQFELIKTQNAGATSMEHEVSAVTRKFKQFKPFEKRHATGGYQQFKGAPNATRDDSCSRCARTHEAGECPATGKRCRKCERIGHFEIVCKTKFLQAVRTTTDVSEDEGCAWFLGSVSEDRDQSAN